MKTVPQWIPIGLFLGEEGSMRGLAARALLVVVVAVVLFIAGWRLHDWMYRNHDSDRILLMRLMETRLGTMDASQRSIVEAALKEDRYLALLAASSDEDRWQALQKIKSPSLTLEVQRLALKAAVTGELNSVAAEQAANAASTAIGLLEPTDPAYAQELVAAMKGLSPDEYRNVAADPSYMQIAPALQPSQRETFRQHQQMLTPILAAADRRDWNALVVMFEKAQPRLTQLLADESQGFTHGLIYMLNQDIVKQLVRAGLTENDAIEFIGINAPALRVAMKEDELWAERVRKLQNVTASGAAGGGARTLLEWSLADPAIYWVISADRSPQQQDSLAVLNWYAGTDLPSTLMARYNGNAEIRQAAISAVAQYENPSHPIEHMRKAGARFITHFQEEEAFKVELARHGPRLIPALSAGGSGALKMIQANPRQIDRWVAADGTAKEGYPWWTWIPGGQIVFVIREMHDGRNLTREDIILAVLDGATVVILYGRAAAPLVRPGTGFVRMAAVTGRETIKAGAKGPARAVLLQQAAVFLRLAGMRAARATVKTAALAGRHPLAATVAAATTCLVIYAQINPQGFEALMDRAIRAPIEQVVGIPGTIVRAIAEELRKEKDKLHLPSAVYYPLCLLLWLGMLAVFLRVLRWLLHPVYACLIWPAVWLWELARPCAKGTPRKPAAITPGT